MGNIFTQAAPPIPIKSNENGWTITAAPLTITAPSGQVVFVIDGITFELRTTADKKGLGFARVDPPAVVISVAAVPTAPTAPSKT